MNYKFLSAFALVGATVAAHGQTYLGNIDLTYVGLGSDDGAFEWMTPGGSDVFTYCMSTGNLFSPGENPQDFAVYSMAGVTAGSSFLTSLLSENLQPGLTNTSFLEAAAEAEYYGTPDLSGFSADVNADIHNTEQNGNSGWDGYDYSEFLYLIPVNPSTYAYAGQPQGFVSGGGTFSTTPGPFSALPMALGLGSLVLRRRGKKA